MENNLWHLWRQILRSPRELGTIAPSSRWLAQGLIEAADLTKDHVIVEVGAGTGPLTQWIRASVPEARFFAMEPNPELAGLLKSKFTDLDISEHKVDLLPNALRKRKLQYADRVLSSIPWSLFPTESLQTAIDAISDSLTNDGFFVTLVYAHARQFPSSVHLKDIVQERFSDVYYSEVVWRNIPPGSWLVCRNPIRQPESRI